jgi:hypothetical protein
MKIIIDTTSVDWGFWFAVIWATIAFFFLVLLPLAWLWDTDALTRRGKILLALLVSAIFLWWLAPAQADVKCGWDWVYRNAGDPRVVRIVQQIRAQAGTADLQTRTLLAGHLMKTTPHGRSLARAAKRDCGN